MEKQIAQTEIRLVEGLIYINDDLDAVASYEYEDGMYTLSCILLHIDVALIKKIRDYIDNLNSNMGAEHE